MFGSPPKQGISIIWISREYGNDEGFLLPSPFTRSLGKGPLDLKTLSDHSGD
jgi:hypothetical protein